MNEQEFVHRPVLLDECIEALAIRPEGVYLEAAACFNGEDGLTASDYLRIKRDVLKLGAIVDQYRDPIGEYDMEFKRNSDALYTLSCTYEGKPLTLTFDKKSWGTWNIGTWRYNGEALAGGGTDWEYVNMVGDVGGSLDWSGGNHGKETLVDIRFYDGATGEELLEQARGADRALLLTAITLHNIPEGMAVGLSFALAVQSGSPALMAGAVSLALGIGVQLLKKEKCCGVALISNGLINQAKRQAEVNIASIRESVMERGLPVLGTSSTCTFTLRDEYPHLLGIDTSDVRDSVELATRYIYRLLESGKAKLRFRKDAPKVKVAYHTPCHMEKLGWSYYSIELLKMIPSVELTVLDSQCCGIAGTYGFKKENYETSQAIGEGLFRQIEATGCDVVATDCETCKWQIEMSTSKRVEHPLSILAAALDVE